MYPRCFEQRDMEAVSSLLTVLDEYVPMQDILSFSALWPRGQLVACDNLGRIIGALFGTVEGKKSRIMVIVVAPDYRKKGVATALINRFRTETVARNLTSITLEVKPGNAAAIRLYAKLGFKETGYGVCHYSDGGDCIVMESPAWKFN